MMEKLKQLLKKNKIFKFFFLFYFIFLYFINPSKQEVLSNSLELQGNLIQGGLLFGKTDPKNKILFNNQKIFVNKQGDFILGIKREEKKNNILTVITKKKKEQHEITIISRNYKIQRIDGLPKNKVTPNDTELKRIKEESKLISKSKNFFLNDTLYKKGFIWPVKGIITGEYGNQRVLNGKPRRPHYGIDIAAPLGTKIIAPTDAEVIFVFEDTFFNGKMIILNHGLGLNSIYSHLHKTYVKKGDKIKKGEVIAEVGSTGRSTGPHLDWRVNVFNIAVDPVKIFENQPKF